MLRGRIVVLSLAVVVAAAGDVSAQGAVGVAPNKCLAGKTKCVSTKLKGLMKCHEQCQKDPRKCGARQVLCEAGVREKFERPEQPVKGCFAKLEAKADPAKPDSVCTTTGDTAAIEMRVDGAVLDLVAALEGSPAPICGDGTAEGHEQCDGADLQGETCTTRGFALGGTLACDAGCGFDATACIGQAYPSTGQVTCWDANGDAIPCVGTGHDGDTQAGAPLGYRDNGDGTITDLNTKLTWEKKSDDGSLHDQSDTYRWSGTCTGGGSCLRDADCPGAAMCDADGPTIFQWVDMLNAATFAGHSDWRIPNIRELASIVDYEQHTPAVSAAFNTACSEGCAVTACSCTFPSFRYWSSTPDATVRRRAWFVLSAIPVQAVQDHEATALARAVRGGL